MFHSSSTLIDNSHDFYPNSIIVEYYLPGTDPSSGGMDWQSLRLVFQSFESQFALSTQNLNDGIDGIYANNGFPPFNMNESTYNSLQDQIDGNPPPGLTPPVDLAQLVIDSMTFPGPDDPQWEFPGPDGDIDAVEELLEPEL